MTIRTRHSFVLEDDADNVIIDHYGRSMYNKVGILTHREFMGGLGVYILQRSTRRNKTNTTYENEYSLCFKFSEIPHWATKYQEIRFANFCKEYGRLDLMVL